MSVSLSYPGVYIEEIPSGVHAITGVPTSIAAFVGRALRGPTNLATTIFSFADFGRQFGGLAIGYPLSYAVRDFFANGGGQAIIVRVWEAGAGSSAGSVSTSSLSSASSASSLSSLSSSSSSSSSSSPFVLPPQADGIARTNLGDPDTIGLALQAQSPGAWGNKVSVQVQVPSPPLDATVATNLGYANTSLLFNLLVTDTGTGTSETIRNVSVVDGSRRLDRVLATVQQGQIVPNESQLVAVPIDPVTQKPQLPTVTPAASSTIFLSGGSDGGIVTDSTVYVPTDGSKRGIYALELVDIFNLLAIPPDSSTPDSMLWTKAGALYSTIYPEALAYCKQKKAVLIVDPPDDWLTVTDAQGGPSSLDLVPDGDYGAIYFPKLVEPDPLRRGQLGNVAPSGAICGMIATTDNARGVWKAPAGIDAGLVGVQALSVQLSDDDNGLLNPLGVNCLRSFPFVGNVVWGARTLRGADPLTDDYKYLPVRRLALYLEQSLFRGLQWVVFEPNDEPLWSQIRLNVQSFMQDLFKKGAFAGTTPKDAFLVKCDSETTTPYDQSIGVVNIVVGFAPLRPAEFVVLQIQQLAGQAAA
jgi:phage tail sheath protein FI